MSEQADLVFSGKTTHLMTLHYLLVPKVFSHRSFLDRRSFNAGDSVVYLLRNTSSSSSQVNQLWELLSVGNWVDEWKQGLQFWVPKETFGTSRILIKEFRNCCTLKFDIDYSVFNIQ